MRMTPRFAEFLMPKDTISLFAGIPVNNDPIENKDVDKLISASVNP